MKELQIFNSQEFGQVRIIDVDGKPYFMASDIAKALGYSNPNKAIKDHCRAITKRSTPISGKMQEVNFIPEGDMYRLITHSKLPSAERFESWVFDEVLPTLRKTGSYEMQGTGKTSLKKEKNLSATNMLVKTVSGLFKEAGVDPMFIVAEAKRLYHEHAGIDIRIPMLTDKSMQELWDCTSIAKKLGILSESGRPHDKAVSAIIQKLDIFSDEVVRTAYSRNGHEGVTVQYRTSVLEKVKEWLDENCYPTVIELELSNGSTNKCRVTYGEVA